MNRANRLGIPLGLALAGWAFCFLLQIGFAAQPATPPIKIRVIDNVTRAPVSGAEVYIRGEGDAGLRKIGVTTNGFLEFAPINDDRMIEFHLEANGYRDRTTLVTVEKEKASEIALYATDIKVRGFVVAAGGQLVSTAIIGFTRGESPAMLEANAHFRGGLVDQFHFNNATVRGDQNGSFEGTAPQGTDAIVVVHELGCGSAPMMGWTNGTTIHLRPWTSLRGRMQINGRPAANRVVVAIMCSFFNSNAKLYLRNYEATTDAEGRFVFDQLPPGGIDVAQKVDLGGGRRGFSHWASFVADASLPANDVVYSIVGRDVKGTLVFKADEPVDWRGLTVFGSLMARQATQLDEFAPLAGGAPWRPPHIFALSINGDGEFSATTIPPGEYALHVSCTDRSRPLAQINGKLVVPPGEEAFDFGKVVVTNTVSR